MKKSFFLFVVVAILITTIAIWFVNANLNISGSELYQIPIIIAIIGFALFIGISRYKSEKRGEPTDDELSKKIMQKASSISYFVSIYLWLVIMYISSKGIYDTEVLFGWGILGMALILAISWAVIYKVGIRSE